VLRDIHIRSAGLVVTGKGYLGMIHSSAKCGDRICLLNAFRNTVVLKP
jgi:hypothetical protein